MSAAAASRDITLVRRTQRQKTWVEECGGDEGNVYIGVVAHCFWVLLTSARSLVQFYSAPDLLFIY